MKLRTKTDEAGVYAMLIGDDGRVLAQRAEIVVQGTLPSFKTGDMWLIELLDDSITTGRVWINPENGVIKVTILGNAKRREFSEVKRWLIKLEVSK